MAESRRLSACLSAFAVLTLAACSPPETPQRRAEPKAAPVVQPCPEDDLMCGKQKPVRSDGVRAFVNANFRLRVTFPEGSPVCLTRSGSTPRGFFVNYGEGPPCAERPERARFIAFYGDYNPLYEPTLMAAAAIGRPCTRPSAALRRAIGARPLSFPGRASIVCQFPADFEGGLELWVYTAAGQQPGDEPGSERDTPVPDFIYFASFGSTPDHLAEDLARFRRILATARIEGADWTDPS